MENKIDIRLEISKDKRNVLLLGGRNAFRELHEKLWGCCGDNKPMTREESLTYIGIVSYLSYELKYAFMGARIIKLDGETVKEPNDEMYRLFEKEMERFEVGVELPLSNFIIIMASWWECYRHADGPMELLPLMRRFQNELEELLKAADPKNYPMIEPYLHGAVYAANPYLMHALEHILYITRVRTTVPIKRIAEAMSVTAYASYNYQDFHRMLESHAARLHCSVAELQFDY